MFVTCRCDAVDVPSLRFEISSDAIVVCNNELGFQEENVRAVCDVGKTTKGKHKFGYIGRYSTQLSREPGRGEGQAQVTLLPDEINLCQLRAQMP